MRAPEKTDTEPSVSQPAGLRRAGRLAIRNFLKKQHRSSLCGLPAFDSNSLTPVDRHQPLRRRPPRAGDRRQVDDSVVALAGARQAVQVHDVARQDASKQAIREPHAQVMIEERRLARGQRKLAQKRAEPRGLLAAAPAGTGRSTGGSACDAGCCVAEEHALIGG